MILVDANILLYAEYAESPFHARAREWWDGRLSEDEPIGLCWTVLNAYLRIGTNRRTFESCMSVEDAAKRIDSWLAQPCVRLIHATDRHWEVFKQLLVQGQALANLCTDAHLAALAIEHGSMLYSTDSDFSRFPGLKWKNPLLEVPR